MCQGAIEMGKAEIVADRQPDAAPGGFRHDGPFAGPEGLRLAIALAAGEVDVEHMDLVVGGDHRSEEHTSELQSLMRISYAVFCLKKKNKQKDPENKQYLQYTP